MLQDFIRKDATDKSVRLRIIDSTDGTPETGVVFNTAGIDLWYRRELAARTAITEATLAALTTAHADGGFLHISDGYYRLDLPDAAFATGANYVEFGGTVTGMVVIGGVVKLIDSNIFHDTVRGGLTALPNAAADAAGGVPISDAGGLDLDTKLANTNEVTAARMGALTDWINGGRLDLILDIIAADTTTDIPATISTLQTAVTTIDDLLDTEVAAIKTDTAAILVDTNELQVDWVNGGRLDLILDIIAADTTTDIPALIATLQTFVDTEITAIDDLIDTEVAAIKTVVDAVLVDTAEIGAAGAGLTALATQTSVDTIDNFLDTEIAAILEDTGTTVDDMVDDLEARLTAALATALSAHSLGVGRGIVDAGSTTTALIIKSINGAAADATNDHYNGRHIIFTSGALLLQACSITDYVGATVTATISAVTDTPADDMTFILV